MKTKIKEKDYYKCVSCNINSLTKDRMCPCPRGNCDAEIIGILRITKEIILNGNVE